MEETNGLTPLGEQQAVPEPVSGQAQADEKAAIKAQVIALLGEAQAALAAILARMPQAPGNGDAAHGRSALAFCGQRLGHETKQIGEG